MELRFTVFADLHYKTGMYAPGVEDLSVILFRAACDRSDFLLHCGDFSNDYAGSPELWRPYLQNPFGLPVYGVYGNHELETPGNTMAVVTPLLTNDDSVLWGTADGTRGDGSIAYYSADRGPFRILCTDTNYSLNPATGAWEHNRPASWGAPAGNQRENSLGPAQLSWLEGMVADAAEKKMHCIVVGHDSFSGIWGTSPDGARVREIFRRANQTAPGTVVLAINGHYHTDHTAGSEGVVWFDVNTAINGYWSPDVTDHYDASHTFRMTEYDDNGRPAAERMESLGSLSMGRNTWFFTAPLSALVTVDEKGSVTIRGTKTAWCYGVEPPPDGASPEIADASFVRS